MKIITKKELAEFIMEQPDHRLINFLEASWHNMFDPKDFFCGCLLIQFAQEKLNIKISISCGFKNINSFDENECLAKLDPEDEFFAYDSFNPRNKQDREIKTFAELKHSAQEYLSSL